MLLPLSGVQEQEEEVVSLVSTCITKAQLQEAVQPDSLLQQMMTYVATKWPAKCSLRPELRPFFCMQDVLAVVDSLLLRDERLVISFALTSTFVETAHEGHQAIVCTKQRLCN